MTLQPEPANNPNVRMMVDPPGWFRSLTGLIINRMIDPARQAKRRAKAEQARVRDGSQSEFAPLVIFYQRFKPRALDWQLLNQI